VFSVIHPVVYGDAMLLIIVRFLVQLTSAHEHSQNVRRRVMQSPILWATAAKRAPRKRLTGYTVFGVSERTNIFRRTHDQG
jgi:hypothetical protein